MYQKYHTEAIVLGGRERGESDRSVALFTSEFGMVHARASAVRSEKSRMRYALQHFTRCKVSLVKGKSGWRVAGATALESYPQGEGAKVFARAATLVRRLVQGEERNEYLYETLVEAHQACRSEHADTLPVVEIVCVARILFALGYISTEALSTALFTHTAFTGESLLEADSLKDKLLASINRALTEAQL